MPNRPTDEIDLGEAGDYRSALRELSEECQKLRQLRELYALKVANRCRRKEVEGIKAQVKRTHSELLQLMLEVEHFTGEIISHRCRARLRTLDPDLVEKIQGT
jgi:hypothetical protein